MAQLPLQVLSASAAAEPADAEADAADAAESEVEENSGGDGVIETGNELGSVQTPASVWLPFETSPPGGKVMHIRKQTMRCSSSLRKSKAEWKLSCLKMSLTHPALAIACRPWGV